MKQILILLGLLVTMPVWAFDYNFNGEHADNFGGEGTCGWVKNGQAFTLPGGNAYSIYQGCTLETISKFTSKIKPEETFVFFPMPDGLYIVHNSRLCVVPNRNLSKLEYKK